MCVFINPVIQFHDIHKKNQSVIKYTLDGEFQEIVKSKKNPFYLKINLSINSHIYLLARLNLENLTIFGLRKFLD